MQNLGQTFRIPYNRELKCFDRHATNVVDLEERTPKNEFINMIEDCTIIHNQSKKRFIGLKITFVLSLCTGISLLAIFLVLIVGPGRAYHTKAFSAVSTITIVFGSVLIVVALLAPIIAKFVRISFKRKLAQFIEDQNVILDRSSVEMSLFYEIIKLEGWWYKRWVHIWDWRSPAVHVKVKSISPNARPTNLRESLEIEISNANKSLDDKEVKSPLV
ncbi:SH3PXD2A [Acrasis kona]|uniref:SH3PXD2A n=1 Tax=Acrasis kona TaxID=1008807 RepID=A0AAW2ZMM5_9EUKA